MKVLKLGSKGPEVELIQQRLKIKVDGDFGPKTEAAVKSFQLEHQLAPDGIVGPLTHARLFKRRIGIPPVHLSKEGVTRAQTKTRAFPLSEKDMPAFDGSTKSIHEIIKWLDVEKSPRYKRTPSSTYCNIYAFDFAYLMGAYLPRVWWSEKAIANQNFSIKYAATVFELNANSLWDWFPHYGSQFGWKQLANTTEAQQHANDGECVIMVAANKNRQRSGHIVVVVPETEKRKGVGGQGIVIYPLQSQAGAINKQYFAQKWWNGMEKLRIFACKIKQK